MGCVCIFVFMKRKKTGKSITKTERHEQVHSERTCSLAYFENL